MPDRKKQPLFQKSLSFKLKTPEAFYRPGKAPVFILHGCEQEVVRLELIFAAGKWFETAPGLSHFSSVLLTKGTSKLSGNEIVSMLDELGFHVETETSPDYTYLTAFGLRKNFKQALEIIKSCLQDPVFPEDELEQQKEIYIQQLKVNQERTSYLASRLFRQNIFGENHPYAAEAGEEQVVKLEREEIVNYYTRYFTDFVIFLSGKTDEIIKNCVIELAEELQWKQNAHPGHTPQPSGKFRVKQSKPNAVQASVRIGKITISRNHPDFPQLVLANYILGGYFGSRLMKVIREEKGLTYGIYSAVRSHKNATLFSIATDVNCRQTDAVIEEILNQLKDLRQKPVQQKELDLAKNHFIGSLQNEMSNVFAHMERFKNIYLFNLEPDYYNNLIHQIYRADGDDVRRIAHEYLHEDDMVIAYAG